MLFLTCHCECNNLFPFSWKRYCGHKSKPQQRWQIETHRYWQVENRFPIHSDAHQENLTSEHSSWAHTRVHYSRMSHWRSLLNFSRLNPMTAPILKNSQATRNAPGNLTSAGSGITQHYLSSMTIAHPSAITCDVWSGAKPRLGSWNPKQGCKMRPLTDLGSKQWVPNICAWPCFLYRYLM